MPTVTEYENGFNISDTFFDDQGNPVDITAWYPKSPTDDILIDERTEKDWDIITTQLEHKLNNEIIDMLRERGYPREAEAKADTIVAYIRGDDFADLDADLRQRLDSDIDSLSNDAIGTISDLKYADIVNSAFEVFHDNSIEELSESARAVDYGGGGEVPETYETEIEPMREENPTKSDGIRPEKIEIPCPKCESQVMWEWYTDDAKKEIQDEAGNDIKLPLPPCIVHECPDCGFVNLIYVGEEEIDEAEPEDEDEDLNDAQAELKVLEESSTYLKQPTVGKVTDSVKTTMQKVVERLGGDM